MSPSIVAPVVAPSKPRRRWLGGYVHVEKTGRELFIIEKKVDGERFHVSSRCHTERAALKALERFERDPEAFVDDPLGRKGRGEREDALYLTAELMVAFRDWMLSRERPASWKHANEMFHRLREWSEALTSVDLRTATLRDHIKPALETWGVGLQHRVIAIKAFYGWLRKHQHLLTSAQDPTLDLPVPQGSPEKHRRRKAVPIQSVRRVLKKLPPAYRDCLLLLANTGWHLSELERFVREPQSQIAPGGNGVLAVLQVRHKSGETTRTPVTDRAVLAAARRLRARRQVPRWVTKHIKAACRAARVPEFGAGVMRHSVATWAVEAGASPEQVAEFLGHKDARTSRRFYIDVAVPTTAVRLPKML